MLSSNESVRLLLLVGKIVPLPVPTELTYAIERVEVSRSMDQASGFQITFRVTKSFTGDYNLLGLTAAPFGLEPYTRVVIGLIIGLTPVVLLDGVITHQQLQPSPEPGQATLTVTGTDLTALMDLIELNLRYDDLSDAVIAETVIARYTEFGIGGLVIPTLDYPIDIERTPWQYETDLQFMQRLAQRNNYVFFLEPILPCVNVAYFGPDVRLGVLLPPLTMDMGSADNLTSISFAQDGTKRIQVVGQMSIPETTYAIPMTLPTPRFPPLAALPSIPFHVRMLRKSAKLDDVQSALAIESAQYASMDTVTATGSVDTRRYGGVLRPRCLVGVRGAGWSYDGLYWITQVTHVIERDKYSQSFSLCREGIGSTTPVV